MNRMKLNIIYLIGLLVLIFAITTTFAAFVFSQSVVVSTHLGGVGSIEKNYLIYAKTPEVSASDPNYSKAEKLRNDTVAIIDNIALNSTKTYKATSDTTFLEGKTYYTDQNGTVATVTPGDTVEGTYYEVNTTTYSGLKTVTGYDVKLNSNTWTVNGNLVAEATVKDKDNEDVTVTLTCTIDANEGILKTASATATGKNYKAVIGTTGLYVTIIDTDLTKEASSYTTTTATGAKITCSASTSKYKPEGFTGNKYYLSQVGLQFSFTPAIDVYVRLHIKDAWTRTRVYSTSIKETYVMKDLVGGKSPFTVTDDNWYYDEATNYLYLKQKKSPVLKQDGTFDSVSYTFDVNESYFYTLPGGVTYQEYIDVDLSFTVELIQANRIKAVWGKDPSTDFVS